MKKMILTMVCFILCTCSVAKAQPLTFDEYLKLSADDKYSAEANAKVESILNGYELNNSISQNHSFNGSLKVVEWNLKGSEDLEKLQLILSGNFDQSKKYMSMKALSDGEQIIEYRDALNELKSADVIILTDVDYGQPKSEYKNITKELAEKNGYNYVYSVNFISVEPKILNEENSIDKNLYKGYNGTAILSKYKLENVQILKLPVYYDWYTDEKNFSKSLDEKKEKLGSEKVPLYDFKPNTRIGSRTAVMADIKPKNGKEKITIVAIETENRTSPEKRASQLQYLLNRIGTYTNPVIIGGNLNTNGLDEAPFSILKLLKENATVDQAAQFVVTKIVSNSNIVTTGASVVNKSRLKKNPAGKSIPIIMNNPEKEIFKEIREFTFTDGSKFELKASKELAESDEEISSKFLGTSNERKGKGFVPTCYYDAFFGHNKYKKDWLLVKGLTPSAPKTLTTLYTVFDVPVSIHVPIVVNVEWK